VTRLDEREKRVARWVAGFGAVSAVALYAPAFDQLAAVVLAFVGVAMAGLLLLASRSGSRLFTCLAAGLLGIGPWGFAYIIGLPFLLFAGWLISRDAQARRATGGRPLKKRPVREKPVREERARAQPVRKKPSGKAQVKEPPKPSRPGRSKRYTPPGGRW